MEERKNNNISLKILLMFVLFINCKSNEVNNSIKGKRLINVNSVFSSIQTVKLINSQKIDKKEIEIFQIESNDTINLKIKGGYFSFVNLNQTELLFRIGKRQFMLKDIKKGIRYIDFEIDNEQTNPECYVSAYIYDNPSHNHFSRSLIVAAVYKCKHFSQFYIYEKETPSKDQRELKLKYKGKKNINYYKKNPR